MNIDHILNLVISKLRQKFPDALYKGSLVKKTRAFNPSTNNVESTGPDVPVEIEVIFDTFTDDEISSSGIRATDVKLYVIGGPIENIDFYDAVTIFDKSYSIAKVITSYVGSTAAVFTIAARR